VARHFGKGLALGVSAIGASLATLAASVTARRITAPGPRDKKFVTPVLERQAGVRAKRTGNLWKKPRSSSAWPCGLLQSVVRTRKMGV
jgi:hypothetical protein